MTVLLLRANHANEYELQNYAPIAKSHEIQVVTSRHPLTPIHSVPVIKLLSLTDLPNFPLRRQILNRLFGGEQWLFGLEKLVKGKDTIIHTAETYTPYTHQAVQMRKSGIISKLICTCWETIPHANEKFRRLRKWKKEAYKYVDIFHTPTIRAKYALIQEGVPEDKIKVIAYGVDLSKYNASSRDYKHLKKKPLVLTLARRVPEKGYDLYEGIKSKLSNLADFQWISDAPYSQVSSLLAKADIFLLPSQSTETWEEQYGMALVEAMAAGLPIITTRSGAIPEVVGDAALMASTGDESAITRQLKHLLTHPELFSRYSKLARGRAKAKYDHLLCSRNLSRLLYSSNGNR